MKKIIIFLLTLILLTPLNTLALSKEYNDIVANIAGEKIEDDKINLYLFYSESCPHCHKELDYLNNKFKEKYKDKVNIYKYEVSKNKDNSTMLSTVKILLQEEKNGVPFTVIGDKYVLGFGESLITEIEYIVDGYLTEETQEKNYNIPIIGNISAKTTSIGLIAIILGFIDGFNPCAMWILLLIINLTITMKDRKKIFLIGLTFIITGGLIYFLSMLGIGFILDLTTVTLIRNIIALVAITLGVYNLYTYVKTRKDTGCHVVDKEKRKSIIKQIQDIMSKKSTILMLLGTIILAVSVNLVELACSLGFPTIFLELLSINNITGFSKIIYLLIYILFYLIDDLVIFLIAVCTLKSKGISTKYNKFVNLIGGILLIIMGLLLIFKPEIIMFNF